MTMNRIFQTAFMASIFLLVATTTRAANYSVETPINELLPDKSFPEFFVVTFDDLMNGHWQSDGNWAGDAQNDATAFAPELLYELDAAISDAQGEFAERAYQTTQWQEQELNVAIDSVVSGNINEDFLFNTAVGSNSFIACAKYGVQWQDNQCRWWMGTILTFANLTFLTPIYDWLNVFQGSSATLYARMIYLNVEYYKATGKERFKQAAIELADSLNDYELPDGSGLYEGDVFGWSQASPLVAFASLYEITQDEQYLIKAENIISALDGGYLFGVPEEAESYWESQHKGIESNDEFSSVAASTHVQYFEAFTILAMATEDDHYIARANQFLEFALRYMYLPSLGEAAPHFSHDISWPNNQAGLVNPQLDFNPSYCSGESFNFLRITWKLIDAGLLY